jgi:hypothetical protein
MKPKQHQGCGCGEGAADFHKIAAIQFGAHETGCGTGAGFGYKNGRGDGCGTRSGSVDNSGRSRGYHECSEEGHSFVTTAGVSGFPIKLSAN